MAARNPSAMAAAVLAPNFTPAFQCALQAAERKSAHKHPRIQQRVDPDMLLQNVQFMTLTANLASSSVCLQPPTMAC